MAIPGNYPPQIHSQALAGSLNSVPVGGGVQQGGPIQFAGAAQGQQQGQKSSVGFIPKLLGVAGLAIGGIVLHKSNMMQKAFKAAGKEMKFFDAVKANGKFWKKGWLKSSDDLATKFTDSKKWEAFTKDGKAVDNIFVNNETKRVAYLQNGKANQVVGQSDAYVANKFQKMYDNSSIGRNKWYQHTIDGNKAVINSQTGVTYTLKDGKMVKGAAEKSVVDSFQAQHKKITEHLGDEKVSNAITARVESFTKADGATKETIKANIKTLLGTTVAKPTTEAQKLANAETFATIGKLREALKTAKAAA